MQSAEQHDPTWNAEAFTEHVKALFVRFQEDWATGHIDSIRSYTSAQLADKFALELEALQAMGRQNIMQNIAVSPTFIEAVDSTDNRKDAVLVEIRATAEDVLLDSVSGKVVYVDNHPFIEFWTFVRRDQEWILDNIGQATVSAKMLEHPVAQFAKRHGLHYDPDFGWLMLPLRGVLFSGANHKSSDVNNHVIGKLNGELIELYTFVVNKGISSVFGANNYLVAQVVLPSRYDRIFVQRKKRFIMRTPVELRHVQTESNEFEKKFRLYAAREDQVNSLVLLAPDFMERLSTLSFEVNVEVVDNFLYLFTPRREGVDYELMFSLLSDARRSLRS